MPPSWLGAAMLVRPFRPDFAPRPGVDLGAYVFDLAAVT
jgi:hypothetical protein